MMSKQSDPVGAKASHASKFPHEGVAIEEISLSQAAITEAGASVGWNVTHSLHPMTVMSPLQPFWS